MQKLELTWVGKYAPENKINPKPRILTEKPEYSYITIENKHFRNRQLKIK